MERSFRRTVIVVRCGGDDTADPPGCPERNRRAKSGDPARGSGIPGSPIRWGGPPGPRRTDRRRARIRATTRPSTRDRDRPRHDRRLVGPARTPRDRVAHAVETDPARREGPPARMRSTRSARRADARLDGPTVSGRETGPAAAIWPFLAAHCRFSGRFSAKRPCRSVYHAFTYSTEPCDGARSLRPSPYNPARKIRIDGSYEAQAPAIGSRRGRATHSLALRALRGSGALSKGSRPLSEAPVPGPGLSLAPLRTPVRGTRPSSYSG